MKVKEPQPNPRVERSGARRRPRRDNQYVIRSLKCKDHLKYEVSSSASSNLSPVLDSGLQSSGNYGKFLTSDGVLYMLMFIYLD